MKTISNFENLVITAEVDINKLNDYEHTMFKDIRLILTINHRNFGLLQFNNKKTTQIKLQAIECQREILTVGSLINFKETDLNELDGKKYKEDAVIE